MGYRSRLFGFGIPLSKNNSDNVILKGCKRINRIHIRFPRLDDGFPLDGVFEVTLNYFAEEGMTTPKLD